MRKLKLPNGETIQYQLERRSRRTIGLKVSADGLTVHAPKLLLVRQIEGLLQEKAQWIQQKLSKQADNFVPPIEWRDNEPLLYLGNDITLKVEQGQAQSTTQINQPTHCN